MDLQQKAENGEIKPKKKVSDVQIKKALYNAIITDIESRTGIFSAITRNFRRAVTFEAIL